ncbi:hypothetical protein CAI21_07620 [Alkalilimnicola ehrlichii]|uniref:ABC-type uncharacterized transport system domain-containing protein n=1 Tax=Alkalilimnicola ehrlichii TaxID=351052 RepID=A0A3E0WWN3_9GAMM|nr:GldG family protein [Alkalilimnicola ehrlichii]RFA30067.1 hypothetical protein CAI21_07620 [Alkalilimnicola ehrlichii]RFA37410.1 hypothetical protein CAL65_08960 [Alkalilimnicola ehrlichii]
MNRRLWLRINGFLFAVLFLSCLAAIAWLSQRHDVSWQWAGAAQTQVTEPSRRLVAQMEQPVMVYAFVPEGHFLERHLEGLFSRYQRHKADFSWQFINPEARPDLVRRMGVGSAGEVVIEYGERREHVEVPNEAHISAALERLQRGSGQRIGFLTGHGERSLHGQANYDLGSFGRALEGKGYYLQALRLAASGQVPAEIDLLLINGPQTDLLPGAVRAVRQYVERGGNLLWLYEPGDAERFPELIQHLGVLPVDGVVTDPKSREMLAIDDPRLILLEDYPAHAITQRLSGLTLFPQIRPLGLLEDSVWLAEPLLITAARHQLAPDFDKAPEERIELAEDERLMLAVSLTRDVLGSEGELRQQRAAMIGDGDFLSNTYIGNGANLQLGLNIVDWLTESEVFLDLYTQAAPDQRLNLRGWQTLAIGFGFLLVLPLAFLAVGGWHWWRRRSG